MATNQQRQHHDQNTRQRFEEVLHDCLISREFGTPETRKYNLQEPNASISSSRIALHKEAAKNTPLSQGDAVKEHYFESLGIVIVDLNPRED